MAAPPLQSPAPSSRSLLGPAPDASPDDAWLSLASPSPIAAAPFAAARGADIERGLFGYDGLAVAPSRVGIIIKVLATMFGYAFSLLINGSASRMLPQRFATPAPGPGVDPLGGLGFAVRVADPIFILSSFRLLASAALMGVMVLRGDVPWGAAAAADSSRWDPGAPAGGVPLVTDARALAAPLLIGFTNALGYALYLALTARGGVAIWSALVGMYVVLPCTYGILVKGEARSPRKLLGIATACVAGVMLVWTDEAAEAESGVSPAQNLAIFFACITVWGVCDGLAGFVARSVHTFVFVGASGLGFGAFALLTAAISYGLVVAAPPGTAFAPPPASAAHPGSGLGPGAAYALMALSQCLGVGAMYACVLLGKTSEASSFLPIISLYTAFTAVLAVVFLGDTLAPLAWAGIVVGAIACLLIAFGGVRAEDSGRVVLTDEQPAAGDAGGGGGGGLAAKAAVSGSEGGASLWVVSETTVR